MPQQPAGPFSQYLTEPIKSQVPNPTGFEGNAAAYAHVGAKFLEGLRQGRLQKAAMAEMENAKTERALEQAIHHVSSIEGVDPAIKQHYQNQLVQQYLGHIAGQKETSKDTGHPVTDMLKNVALNLSGGQLPGKKAGLDLNLVGEAMTALNDPSNRVDQRLSRLNSDLSAALQSGNVTDIRTAYANPQVAQYLNEGRRLTGRADWTPDVFQSLAPDAIKSEQEKLQLGVLKSPQFQSAMTGSQQRLPQTSPPPMGASDVGAEAPTGPPPTAGVNTAAQTHATTQPPGTRNFLSVVTAAQQTEANRTWQSKVAGTQLPPSDNVIPKIGNPESYVDASGNRFNGVFNPSQFQDFTPGVYDATTGEARPNAQRAALYNPEKDKALTPEQQTQMIAKLSGDVDIAIPDKQLAAGAKAAINSQIASGDVKGAADIIARYQQMHQSKQNSIEARNATAALAGISRDLSKSMHGFQVAQQFNSSEPVKKMRVIDEYTNNVNSAYQSLKTGGDPGIYDLEIMRAWAKITDPLTGVREGEYRDIAGVQGPWRDFQVHLDRIFKSNGGKLDNAARETIVSAINRIHNNQYETQFKPLLQSYQQAAGTAGLGAKELLNDPYSNKQKTAAPPTAQPAPAKLMGGKTNPFRQGAIAAQPVVTIKAKP